MSTEQSRADFERTMQKRLGSLIDFTRNTHDDYIRLDAAVAWISWQASRTALALELPTEHELRQEVCSECASNALDMVEKRLHAAGITVKE